MPLKSSRAAAALLVALALGLVLPATALTQPIERTPRPRPPVVLIPNDAGISEPVHVQSLDVDVHVSGFLAETTLVMTFHNPNDRIVEGHLAFPLPEGATVSGFGLDVGGELVDGVVVERQQARVAFETEVRRNIDPGLAEWVQGSVFRTRIYPFAAQGNRTVKLSYVSDLTIGAEGASYHLPLAYQQQLDRFHVRVAVDQGPAAPSISGGGLSNLDFGAWESQFVAESTLTEVTPDEDLVVAVPADPSRPLIQRAADGAITFVIQDHLPDLEAMAPRPAPSRVALLFDASASRNDADIERELGFLAAWLAAHPGTHVDLVVIRDRLSEVRAFAPGDDRDDELLYALRDEPLDGGTDLSAMRFPGSLAALMSGDVSGGPTSPIDAYLFFSDGLGSLGEPGAVTAEVPVIAITSSAEANHAWLRRLAEVSGGRYLNLQRVTDAEALAAVGTTPLRLMGIEMPPEAVDQVQVVSPLPDGGRLVLAGRLLGDEATLTLRYGLGGELVHSTTFVLEAADAVEGSLAGTFWAQLRIADLALNADRNREALRRLGRDFNLVTPETSYIVLETLEQHLTHGIPPAPSRPAMLAEYEQRRTEQRGNEASREAERLDRVAAQWSQRVAWWEAHGTLPPGSSPPATSTPATPPGRLGDVESSAQEEVDSRQVDGPAFFEDFSGGTSDRTSVGQGAAEPGRPTAPPEARERRDEAEMEMPADLEGLATAAEESASDDMRATRSGPDSGGEDDGDGAESGAGGTISVQEWDPETPYLAAMRAVEADDAYGVYLDQIHTHGRSPAFYLDVATYLYRIDRPVEARRVLTNISELELADARLLRIVAYKLQEEGELDLAIRLFDDVLEMRPEEPQSRRDLALALAERADRTATAAQLDDPQAPVRDWARAMELLDAMVRSDTGRFNAIEMPALMEANRIRGRMERYAESSPAETSNSPELADNPIDPRLRQNLDLDIRVILRWDTDQTDMDLWVDEPSGERCYYGNTSTAYGAMYGRDYTIGYGPEEYLIRTAPAGNYLVQANYYGSRQQALTGGTTLQVDIFTDWGRASEQRHRGTIRLTTRGETVEVGTVAWGDEGAELRAGERIRVQ